MTQETDKKILVDFFQAFRIAIFNASIYSTTHSVFRKSIEEFKRKLDAALMICHPLTVMIAPRYLMINEQKFEKDQLYEELSKFLHHRSIKSVKFQQGVTLEELDFFLIKASSRIREIIKEGGLDRIIKTKQITSIHVEMLDYSQILKGSKEDKDIWAYLLQKVVADDDDVAIEPLVENFNHMVTGVGVKELLTNGDLQESIAQFLTYLSTKREAAFAKCGQSLLRTLVRGRMILKNNPVPDSFKQVLQVLNAAAIMDVVIDELLVGNDPDAAILESLVFLLAEGKHNAVASALVEKITNKPLPKMNATWLNRLIKALGLSTSAPIKDIYYPILAQVVENVTKGDIFHFDPTALPEHFHKSLFYLVEVETRPMWLSLVVDQLVDDLQKVPVEDRIEHGREIVERVERRHARVPVTETIILKTHQALGVQVEEIILDGQPHPEFDDLALKLRASGLTLERYMMAIFQEQKVNTEILRLFMKFFPGALAIFQQHLNKHLADTKFILRLLDAASKLDPSSALTLLKVIFSAPNPYVRAEVLSIMETLPVKDKEFLLSLLKIKNLGIGLKEAAVSLGKDDPQFVTQAINILLPVSEEKPTVNIEDSVKIVGRLKLQTARPRLEQLSANISFWQQSLRSAIAQSLEQLKHE